MLALFVASIAACAAVLATAAGGAPRSSLDDLSASFRDMQAEDSLNPGMLWVLEGEALWSSPAGKAGRSCSDCHGDAVSMRGVAARYPAWDEARQQPITLSGRIAQCREVRQLAEPAGEESEAMLGLTAWVGMQSRGMPMSPPADPRLDDARARGAALFERRQGQLNLSCAQCHEERAGMRLGSAVIPQGHANGYPQYRLEWQALGPLARRLRNCMTGVRAEPWPPGSPELIELELHLALRAAGLRIEIPAVRP